MYFMCILRVFLKIEFGASKTEEFNFIAKLTQTYSIC
jgi:hypothetical protein